MAAEAVETHRLSAIEREQWRPLIRWMEGLGPDVTDTHPRLVLTQAWLAHTRTDWNELRWLCDRAERLLDTQREPPADEQPLRGEIAALRAQAAYWMGDAANALQHAEEALVALPSGRKYAWTTATIFKGASLQMLGRADEAAAVLRGSVSASAQGRPDFRASVGLAVTALIGAEIQRAVWAAERLLAQATPLGLENSISWSHYFLGTASYLQNDLPAAERHFESVQPYAAAVNAAKQSAYGLAWIRQSRGDIDGALRLLDEFDLTMSDLAVPLGHEIRLLKSRLTAVSGRPEADLPSARTVLSTPPGATTSLDACFESSVITALSVLATAGTSEDMPLCQHTVQRVLALARGTHNVFRSIQCLILQALVLDRLDRGSESLTSLQEAVALAAPGRFIRLFPELGDRVYVLLAALRKGEEHSAFFKELLSAFPAGAAAAGEEHLSGVAPARRDYSVDLLLTNRELNVLELLEQRMSNKEIARQLFISPATVKRHTLSIYRKLGVRGRREAVAEARHMGLLGTTR
jgi:LuxR family maltose regulon positive regulatory protein